MFRLYAIEQTQRLHRCCRPLCAAALLCLGVSAGGLSEAATRIYRTVDEHGNVVFTDVPPRSEEEGKAVDLNHGNAYSPPQPDNARSLESWLGREQDEQEREAVERYAALSVAHPPHNEALRDNAGNVTVVAEVKPGLHPNHVLELYLDGELVQSGRSPTFQLSNLDRGTHTVELRIADAKGQTLAVSPPSTFHLQRRSVILQPANRAK